MREFRVTSLLDRGGFLQTDKPETLGLSSASLDKLKAGLRRAMHLADRLADTMAEPEVTRTRDELCGRLASLQLDRGSAGPVSDEDLSALRDAEHQAHAELTRALRGRQRGVLRGLAALDLALLLTLCEAASAGWQRYMARRASVDVRFYSKMEAFGELVLREGGSFTLWAFVRGTGRLLAYVGRGVGAVAEELWWHGVGFGQGGDGGLCSAVHEELRGRFLESRPAAGGSTGPEEDEEDEEEEEEAEQPDADGPMVVKMWAHGLVAQAIGCDAWVGYYAGGVSLSLPPSP